MFFSFGRHGMVPPDYFTTLRRKLQGPAQKSAGFFFPAGGRNFLFTKGYKTVTMKDKQCVLPHTFQELPAGDAPPGALFQRRDEL